MKFILNKNNLKSLTESKKWWELYGNEASIAADLIEEILKDPEKFDLSSEEIDQLEIAYNILFDCAPHVQESLEEATTPNLSDKSNSISGLLLDHKAEIDSASSQAELVKVCKEILAEKGGNKAQQFLAVLNTKKNHYAALKYIYDFILAGEGMRSPDSKRKTVKQNDVVKEGLSSFEITSDRIARALQCLEDNGVDSDETEIVLQALGYILLDKELFPDEDQGSRKVDSLEEEIKTVDELEANGFEHAGYRKQYDFYRKLVDGKGKWYAVDTKEGKVFPITWDQAVGYEPIDSTEGMAMKLGSILLPH